MAKVLSLLMCLAFIVLETGSFQYGHKIDARSAYFVSVAEAQEAGYPELSRRFISLRQIHKGMTQKEVEAILYNKVITGYEMSWMREGQYKPIVIKNPYRQENFQKGAKKFKIYYYLVGIKKADGQVTNDELVPLVFRDKKLVGKGWRFLRQKIKK